MLQCPKEATVAEMVEATVCLTPTAHGSISGDLKTKLGLHIAAEKVESSSTHKGNQDFPIS